ncbi:DUF6538 domain-containing protein [Parasphingorhabdus sp.]|uniref:DUF6538 domain-containing protein n=1 Tax=Parasphingorhabdus sp. TaxID=2709688 RepID=UPI003D2C3713
MALENYLHKRPNSPNYQVRIAVPSQLHSVLKKREITKSMKTSDRKIAEVTAMQFIAEQKQLFERLSARDESVAPKDLHSQIVETYFDGMLEEFVKRTKAAALAGAEELQSYHEKLKIQKKEWQRLQLAEDFNRIENYARSFVTKHGFNIEFDSMEFEHLLPSMMETIVAAIDVALKRFEGDFSSSPQSKFVLDTKAMQSQVAKKGERIVDLLPRYIDEQESEYGRKRTSLTQDETVILTFAEWIGEEREIGSISIKDAARFRDDLKKLPKSRGKIKSLSGRPIQECISLAKKQSLPLLSTATKSRYISQLSAFFGWLKKRGICDHNIWLGMTFKVDKSANRRPAYTDDQLNRILASPLFKGFEKDKKEHVAGTVEANDWRKWIPLLCLFTGARVSEIAQLYIDDIEERDGRLIAYLKVDADRGQSIKSGQSRLVVFHSKLIEAGFKDYWREQQARADIDDNMQLFPDITAGKRPELGAKPARWWGNYLKKIGIKTPGDGLGTHSFRHRLSDEMRLAGYQNADFGFLVMGHSDGSMTARYGDVPQGTVEHLAEMIENAKFKDVDFSSILLKQA